MSKYIKVAFGNRGANYEYKINEINIADNWNPSAKKGRDFGGFNFSTEDKIIRWLHRGDTLYDVIIPEDTEVIDCIDSATPHGVFRSNKIILTNPRKVDDKMALAFYKKSTIPEISYYKTLGVVSIMGYRNTALAILRDKVNEKNIDLVLQEWNDFINKLERKEKNELVIEVDDLLNEIKNPLTISMCVSKKPYIKELTKDNIINLTGQSGSGKSYYAKENFNNENYEIIDTDDIFSDKRFLYSTGINKELGNYFREKYKILPNLSDDFDLIYKEILEYCKDFDKTIVIDCAQFHCIKNINILKGKIIIIRTDIDTCYKRAIERWIRNKQEKNITYTEDEYENYCKRKRSIYKWYKGSNEFIKKIDMLNKI